MSVVAFEMMIVLLLVLHYERLAMADNVLVQKASPRKKEKKNARSHR